MAEVYAAVSFRIESNRNDPIEPLGIMISWRCRGRGRRKGNVRNPALGSGAAVAKGIGNSRDCPACTQDGSSAWVAQTRDKESTKERGLVLGEVGVRTLS